MEILIEGKTKIVSKGTILIQQGDFCQVVFKVVKGCLKSYAIDKAGKEHIVQFAPEDWYISDLDSFMNNKPSTIFIDAIEDSEVLLLTKPNQSDEDPGKSALIEVNNRLVRNIISINSRLIALLVSSAEERYIGFMQIYPSLVQRLPLKLIASYIGITPEYLSEIRRKIALK